MFSIALLLTVLPILPAALAAEPVTITITDTLDPSSVTVVPGTSVTWINEDTVRHRIRTTSGPVDFDTGNLEPGDRHTLTLNSEGTYSYIDDRNEDDPNYFGTIVVSVGGDEAPPPEPPTTGTTVDVVNRVFRPANITIAAGTTVTWRNIDDRPHTATARDRSFDSGIFDTGASWARTFNSAGTFEYFCTLHPDMVGTVTVSGGGGGGGEPPPPAPPPEPPPPPPPGDVSIFDNGYSPSSVSVPVGSTLVWSNTGALPHTVTGRSGGFDSGFVMAGETYRRTFNSAGTFEYFCSIHPEMVGTVTVSGDGGGGEPPPEPPPDPADPITAGPSDLVIFDNGFDPVDITVAAGSTLTWANTGALPHTVTARDGGFDSGFLMAGDTWNRTFETSGTFEYFCTLHPEMTARVVVVEGGGSTGSADGDSGPAPPPATEGGDSGTGNSPDGSPANAEYSIDVVDLDFSPRIATVPQGATVIWKNVGEIPHTVTAEDGSFDSGIMVTGDAFTWTFDVAGTYDYICTLHPGMEGIVVVTAPPVIREASIVPSQPTSIWVAVIFVSAIAVAAGGLAGGMVIFGRLAAAERGPRVGM